MDILVDLSQEHPLQSVKLSRHLLGEVLQVSRLYHFQTLKDKEGNKRHLVKKKLKLKLKKQKKEKALRKRTVKKIPEYSLLDRAIITGEKQTNCLCSLRTKKRGVKGTKLPLW